VCAVWVGFDDNQQLGLTGGEATLPAWIEFMKDALAIRPSLGGSSFAKPGGIVTVKIDPDTGELAGPNCPTSQTVNVAVQFAPRLECFKHLPDVASEDETVESESLSESDLPLTDSASVRPNQSEASTEQTLSPSVYRDPDQQSRTSIEPKVIRQDTQSEFSPNGRVTLINAPAAPNDTMTPKSVMKRRP
jgi:membrane peptidoglycan carboxypeptidase